jgi:hypothetical protein
MRRQPEVALGAAVVRWLDGLGWDVYQEVEGGPGRADVVAVARTARPMRVWVIECKVTLGLALLEQAARWIGKAHYVSVASPARRPRALVDEVLAWKGIGALRVASERVAQPLRPQLRRAADTRPLLAALRPEHKLCAPAGSTAGGQFTPFRATCRALAALAREEPGIPFAEALRRVPTHYASKASARSSLRRWIREGIVPGVHLAQDPGSGRLRLHPG